MGLISLNDKRQATGKIFNTTGKEKSYHAADQFTEYVTTPQIEGKYHWYDSLETNMGGFGAFWEDTDGNLSDLTFVSNSPSFSVNERTGSTHAAHATNFSYFSIDLTGKDNGRPVFYVRRGGPVTDNGGNQYGYRIDVAFDDFSFTSTNDTTIDIDPSTSSVRSNALWKRSGTTVRSSADGNSVESYATAKSTYAAGVTLSDIPNNNNTASLLWNYRTGSTPSSNTGPDNAADNSDSTYYLYFEASTGAGGHEACYLTWRYYRNINTGSEIT